MRLWHWLNALMITVLIVTGYAAAGKTFVVNQLLRRCAASNA